MNKIENLEDHMAFSCQCGCVRFNLLKSGGIECDDCGEKIMDTTWGQAIEQAEKQEPVAWMSSHDVGFKRSEFGDTPTVPLYTTPQPQREWVGLTDEEIGRIAGETLDPWSCARAIEAAHGIKGET